MIDILLCWKIIQVMIVLGLFWGFARVVRNIVAPVVDYVTDKWIYTKFSFKRKNFVFGVVFYSIAAVWIALFLRFASDIFSK